MDNAEGQVVALSPLDNLMMPCWVKLLFYFKMAPEASIAEIYQVLRRGLSLAVMEMPICGGIVHLRPKHRHGWKPRELEVRIPKDVGRDGAFPLDFADLSDELAFDDIRAARFPAEALGPRRLMKRSYHGDMAVGVDATAAQANFVDGGCIIGLAMWHSVVDARGTYNFARTWASHCRKLQTQPGWESEWLTYLPADVIAANCDRDVLAEIWRKEAGTGKTNSAISDAQWRILGIHPPRAAEALKAEAPPAEPLPDENGNTGAKKSMICVFSLSDAALEQLGRDVGQGDTSITTEHALHALLWRCTMRARFPTPVDRGEMSEYQMALDQRQCIGGNGLLSYLGDTFFFYKATMPLTAVTASTTSLTDLARMLRATVDSVSRADLLEAFGAARELPGYADLPYSVTASIGASMIVVTHQYMSLPELDFGPALGSPACERPPGDEWNDLFHRTIIMPTASGSGLEVLSVLFEDQMERLQADAEFGRYAKLASY